MESPTKSFIILWSALLMAALRENSCCRFSTEMFEEECTKTLVCYNSIQNDEDLQMYINSCQRHRYTRYGGEMYNGLQIRLELNSVMEFEAYNSPPNHVINIIGDSVRSLNSSEGKWSDISWPLMGSSYEYLNVLNVSHNNIATLDAADIVKYMKNLTILDLSYNEIRFINNTSKTKFVSLQLPDEYEDYPSYGNPSPQLDGKVSSPLRTLLLSNNYLETIGEKVLADFAFLRKLDVSFNNIQSKKLNFDGLENLVELNLSNNNISSLGSSLSMFTKLWILDISFNKISDISEENFRYTNNLRVLNVTHNRIKHIDSNALQKIPFLLKIDLSNNFLVGDIFTLFSSNIRLKVINVRNNSISVLGKNTFLAHNLTSIDISCNQISGKLEKDALTGFPDMTEMDLSGQRFTEIGSYAFKGAPSLSKLNLSSNVISSVDESSFRGLMNLKYLDLSNNDLTNIDFEKNDLVDLIWLSLEANALKQITKNVFSGLNSLRHLDISNNYISQIAENGLSLDSLKYLHFSNNSLTGVLQSNAFYGLTSLPKLDISYSKLTALRNRTFVDLKELTEINISHNSLSEVDYNAFVNINQLEILDLSHNTLPDFLVNISSISNLLTLYLNHNNLLKIQEIYFINLKALQTLVLSNNMIAEIENNSLITLESLSSLDLANNLLTDIPKDTFKHHRLLSSIDISNNELTENNLNIWNIHTRNIYMEGNQITEISKLSFLEFNSLQVIDVSYNRLTQISSRSLRKFIHLSSLDISGNMITDIAPGSFTNLSSIVLLNVSHNILETISFGTFNGLSHLEILDISYNNIFEINPNKFETLKNLRYLLIDHNKIESINMRQLLNLVKITKISIGENPLDCNWLTEAHRLVDSRVLEVSFQALAATHETENVRRISCTNEGPSSVAFPNADAKPDSTNSKELFRYFDRLSSVFKSGMDSMTKNLSQTQRKIVEALNKVNRDEEHAIDMFRNFASNFTSDSHIDKEDNKQTSSAVMDLIKEQNNTLFQTLTALQNVIKTMHVSNPVTEKEIREMKNTEKEVVNDHVQSETFKLIDITKNLNSTMMDFHKKIESAKTEMKDMRDKLIKELEATSRNKVLTEPKSLDSSLASSSSDKRGDVNLALTESCVLIILIILCGFIAYRVYQLKRWRPRSTSLSTQRISNEIEI